MTRIIETGRRTKPNPAEALGDLSEYFIISMMDGSLDCIAIIELDGSLIYLNRNGQAIMEIDDFALIAGEAWANLWPEEAQDEIDEALELARDGFSTRLEAFSPTRKGTPRWWDITISPILDGEGEVARILTISRDITAQIERQDRINRYDLQLKELNEAQARTIEAKQALLERQDVLMREIDHRVKNSLAIITSMMRMQATRETDVRVIQQLNAAANRVMSVGRVHERLYQGDDITRVNLKTYLVPLCQELIETARSRRIKISSDIEALDILSDKAIAIGLVVSELVGNALKHAFPDGRGKIEVSAKTTDDGHLEIRVSDNGIGLPDGFNHMTGAGLGMKVIQLYTGSLSATFDSRSLEDGGAQFSLTLPYVRPETD